MLATRTLSVSLQSDVVYVTGTVNDVPTTWTQQENNAWITTADRAADRTQADVDFVRQLAAKGWASMTAQERAAWKSGLKGAYNASDLNRVGSAVEYVANRLREAGYIVTVHPRTGWTEEELPIAQSMYAYLSDVKVIRGVLPLPELPTLPEDMSRLTYTDANAIEQVLLDVNAALDRIRAGAYYAGELYANDV